jgi:hypothetical protein
MDLSIVIVSWNVREYLDACLRSIQQNVCGLTYETIVVDNASRDGSAEMVRQSHPAVHLIANSENVGYCRGNNQGIGVTTGDFIVLLNPDTEVTEGAMERLVGFLREHLDVGIVGPMLKAPSSFTQPNGTRFPSFEGQLLEATGLRRWMENRYIGITYGRTDFSQTAQVDVVCGACLLARRDVFTALGGLDENLVMYFDEADFCRRARALGWKTWYVADACVFHHWMRSVSQQPIASTIRLYRSQLLYFRKHHGLMAALALRFITLGTVGSRAARIWGVSVRDRLLRRGAAA